MPRFLRRLALIGVFAGLAVWLKQLLEQERESSRGGGDAGPSDSGGSSPPRPERQSRRSPPPGTTAGYEDPAEEAARESHEDGGKGMTAAGTPQPGGAPKGESPPTSDGPRGAGKTKAELYELATELGIKGRSKMSKAELERAVRDAG